MGNPKGLDLMNADKGIFYVATGRRFIDEARDSAFTARRWMPGTPILLHTDAGEEKISPFDEIRPLVNPRHFFIDKIQPLLETPFGRTIFLDTDTRVCADISDLFSVLDRFDIAVTHAPLRHDRPFPTPNCFAELNTGVIAYRKCEAVDRLIRRWLEIYEQEVIRCGKVSDQAAFRQAAYESDARLYVLPSEYNLRTVMPAATGRGSVRIIHGRAASMENLERRVNGSRSIRVFLPTLTDLDPDHFIILSRLGCLFGTIIGLGTRTFRVLEKWKRRLFGAGK